MPHSLPEPWCNQWSSTVRTLAMCKWDIMRMAEKIAGFALWVGYFMFLLGSLPDPLGSMCIRIDFATKPESSHEPQPKSSSSHEPSKVTEEAEFSKYINDILKLSNSDLSDEELYSILESYNVDTLIKAQKYNTNTIKAYEKLIDKKYYSIVEEDEKQKNMVL